MTTLSIDLGTSNTVAVLAAHGRPPAVVEVEGSVTMPSAVFATEDGTLVVGREAVRRARLDPARFEPNPKRRIDEGTLLLGDRVVAVTEALGAVLGRVHTEVRRQLGGAAPAEVRLTHPAQWGPVRRNSLLAAARLAGFGMNLVLIPEPVAAAAHFAALPGHALGAGQSLAVYDLGGGTFDVSVVGVHQDGFTVLAESGLADLGGLDIDNALLTYLGHQVGGRAPEQWARLRRPVSVADRRAARTLWEDVRATKESLSEHPHTEMALPEPFGDALVTRAELEGLVRPNLLRSVELMTSTLRSSGVTPDRLAGVYLVGGSSRMPLVARLISERLRVVPTSVDVPETAVALGAHHVPGAGGRPQTSAVPMSVPMSLPMSAPMSAPVPVSAPVPAPAVAPPAFGAPAPKRRKRLLVVAAVVVVLAAAGTTGYLMFQDKAEAQAGDDTKYTTVPACADLAKKLGDLPPPATKDASGNQPPERQGHTTSVFCEYGEWTETQYSVGVSLSTAPGNAKESLAVFDDRQTKGFTPDPGLGFAGRGLWAPVDDGQPPNIQGCRLQVLDGNEMITVGWAGETNNSVRVRSVLTTEECRGPVRALAKRVHDAVQPA